MSKNNSRLIGNLESYRKTSIMKIGPKLNEDVSHVSQINLPQIT
jgi:hypothetical protein